MKNQLNSSGIFSPLEILQEVQKILQKWNINPEEFTDRIIFMPMFNDIDWTRKGNDGICIPNSEKLRNTRKRFSRGHWTFLGPGDDKKWYGTLLCAPEGKWDSTATQMVERWKNTSLPVFKNISALSSGILKKKNGRDTTHFNAHDSNTELLFRISHSVNQLSIYGAVSTWCQQFGLTEEEKEQERPLGKKESVTKGVLSSVKSQEVKLFWYTLQDLHLETVCGEAFRISNHCPRQFDSQGYSKTQFSCIALHLVWEKPSPNPEPLQQFLKEQLLDQSLMFRSWKFLTNMDPRLQFHHPMTENGHPMLWFPEEKVGSVMTFIFPMPNSDQVQNFSLNFRNLREENFAWQSRHLATRNLVRSMLQVQLASRKLMRTPSAFLPARRLFTHKEPFLRPRGSGKLFLPVLRVWRSSVNSGLQKGYKNGTSLRSRWTTIWRITSLGLHEVSIAESVRKTWSTRFLRWTMASTNSWRNQQDKVRVLRGFQKFLGLRLSNSRTLWWNTNWTWVGGVRATSSQMERVYLSQGVVPSASNLSLRPDWFRVETKATKGADNLIHTTWGFWWRLRWRRSQWWLRMNTVRKTLNPTTRAKSHTEKQLAIAAAATAAAVYLLMCRLVQGNLSRNPEPTVDKKSHNSNSIFE